MSDVLALWEVPPPGENDVSGFVDVFLYCRDCFLRWADAAQHFQQTVGVKEALLSLYQSELCVLDRVRKLREINGHQFLLPPKDARRLLAWVNSSTPGCASTLLNEQATELPDHVCAAVAAQSYIQAEQRNLRPSDRALLYSEMASPPAAFVAECTVASAIALISRDPDSPVVPFAMVDRTGYAYSLAVRRESDYGSVLLRSSVRLDEEAAELFGDPRLLSDQKTASPDAQKWVRSQKSQLEKWYNHTFLGKPYARQGRPVGSAVVLDAIRRHYPELKVAAARRTRKAESDLTATDLAKQTELRDDVPSVARSSFSTWWNEEKLPRPGEESFVFSLTGAYPVAARGPTTT